MMCASLYSEMPQCFFDKSETLGVAPPLPDDFVKAFCENRSRQGSEWKNYFPLVYGNKKSRNATRRKTKSKTLSAKDRRLLKVHDLRSGDVRYADFILLNCLWVSYFRNLVDTTILKTADNCQKKCNSTFERVLLKADYHGCIMSVTKSKCPTMVGICGIIVQETRNVIRLVTTDDRLKTIPKQNSVFTFVVDDVAFTLHGNHFCVKSNERAVRKFKNRTTFCL